MYRFALIQEDSTGPKAGEVSFIVENTKGNLKTLKALFNSKNQPAYITRRYGKWWQVTPAPGSHLDNYTPIDSITTFWLENWYKSSEYYKEDLTSATLKRAVEAVNFWPDWMREFAHRAVFDEPYPKKD